MENVGFPLTVCVNNRERHGVNNMDQVHDHPFLAAFRGRFAGVLRWHQLTEFWNSVHKDAAGGWYIYAVGTPPPEQASSAEQVSKFIEEIDLLLHQEHDEDYCGVVYADDLLTPGFIKIFDPNNLGVSCGYSDDPPLPGWILSKLQPMDLQARATLPGNRRRWWQRLWSR